MPDTVLEKLADDVPAFSEFIPAERKGEKQTDTYVIQCQRVKSINKNKARQKKARVLRNVPSNEGTPNQRTE